MNPNPTPLTPTAVAAATPLVAAGWTGPPTDAADATTTTDTSASVRRRSDR